MSLTATASQIYTFHPVSRSLLTLDWPEKQDRRNHVTVCVSVCDCASGARCWLELWKGGGHEIRPPYTDRSSQWLGLGPADLRAFSEAAGHDWHWIYEEYSQILPAVQVWCDMCDQALFPLVFPKAPSPDGETLIAPNLYIS